MSDTLTYHDRIFFPKGLLLWTDSIKKKEEFFHQVLFILNALLLGTREYAYNMKLPLHITT